MAQKIIVSVSELADLAIRLKTTADEINNTANDAVKAAKELKKECDASAMMLIPSLSTSAKHYIESMYRQVRTLRIAIESYQGIDKEIAKKAEDIDTQLLDSLVVVSENYKAYMEKYNKVTKTLLDKLAEVKGSLQVHKDIYSGELYTGSKRHADDPGECTTVVRTVALNRLGVLYGVDKVWTVTETWNAQGKGATPKSKNNSDYPYRIGDYKFTADRVRANDINGQSNFDYLLSKISDHPEGVTYYSPYYNKNGNKINDHAALISDIIPTGDPNNPYIIYAYDGCSNGGNRDLIQNTKLFKDYIYPGKEPITTQDVINAINDPRFFNYFEFYNKVN